MVLSMKNNKLKILSGLSLTVWMGFSALGQSQRGDLVYAEAQFARENYRQAAREYEQVYRSSPGYQIAKRTALSLDRIYEFSSALTWWDKVVSFPEATREDHLARLVSLRRTSPEVDLSRQLTGGPYRLDDFPELTHPLAVLDVPYRTYEISAWNRLNSGGSDYALTEVSREQRLFSSNRGDIYPQKKKGVRFDAFEGKFTKGRYHADQRNYYSLYSQQSEGEPVRVSVDGFELYHLADPFLVENTQTIFFTATPDRLKRKDAMVYPGIFRGRFIPEENRITDVVAFDWNQTNRHGVISPVVDASSQRLYFASNGFEGQGGYDLFYVEYDQNWTFGKPVNLGPAINTSGNERDVFFREEYLYFSSDGHPGFGGLDVFRVSRAKPEVGRVENLGAPINTVADDFGFRQTEEREAYLSSDRLGGKGYDDFYKIVWTNRSLKFLATEDLVVESLTGEILSLEQLSQLLYSKGETEVVLSQPGYFREVRRLSWDPGVEQISLDLTKVPVGLEVFQSVVYYDVDRDDLKSPAKKVLDELTAWMKKYPQLQLMIESHTDSRASQEYNERLSARRSASVVNYLEGKGISKDRLVASWYSKSRLINECGDGIPCESENHQANRRSELKLVAFPDAQQRYDLPKGASMEDFKTQERAKAWFLNPMGISR